MFSDLSISFAALPLVGEFLVSVLALSSCVEGQAPPPCVWLLVVVVIAGASSWRRWSPLSCPARPSDATEAAVRFTRLVGPAFRPPGHAQAHLRTRHSQHPATRIHLVCGPSRSFLGAKKSAGRFHWVMGSFWRGGRGGVGGELKALFGGTGGPGAEQGGGASTS